MIDLDKEEFLRRLDVRFAAFSSLLETHEKYIVSLCESRKVFKDATKSVERYHRELHKFIEENDKRICDFFGETKLSINYQETSPIDVANIIRCKDCKHYKAYEPPIEDFDGWCKVNENEYDKEFYCSYGERNEE